MSHLLSQGASYYANGQIQGTGPIRDDNWGTIKDNGIQKVYYENGQLKLEAGTCPGGAGVQDNGIYREYSEGGKMTSEKYLIKGKECTKAEWKDWLKKHPEDIKYSGKVK